jgi:hypothetical protein
LLAPGVKLSGSDTVPVNDLARFDARRKRRGESTCELGLTICGRVAGELGYRGWRRNRLTRCFW